MPSPEEEIAHLRERAGRFVALASEHHDNDRVRQTLMTIAADLYTKAAELQAKLKRSGVEAAPITYALDPAPEQSDDPTSEQSN